MSNPDMACSPKPSRMAMYPDWPESDADLVPLPQCDGPKLKPFKLPGSSRNRIPRTPRIRSIFTRLQGQNPGADLRTKTEPFSCECRAYGRLQETGNEELAIECFGYILLSEANEHAMVTKFGNPDVFFTGDLDYGEETELRTRFLGKDGRAPPLRGIVKRFGRPDEEDLSVDLVQKIFQDVIKLQTLGIFAVDVHLNPHLTPDMISDMERFAFALAVYDYRKFEDMVNDWNFDHGDQKGMIPAYAYPYGPQRRYNPPTLYFNADGTMDDREVFEVFPGLLWDCKEGFMFPRRHKFTIEYMARKLAQMSHGQHRQEGVDRNTYGQAPTRRLG
ncbi:hypothetical protein F4813DRAFT_401561 [Daldinia decipiens]|uniref:uncharacterized protein n=1 Tax=Daldinia decipiens TaxID=326647 RepID=UPI0020C45CE0|nr:uncharacterized protein F4813DRAFT_401561 [Daldinia decipiens]KAI1659572.1 hypothetical protein F4813DRAFT_401561 [Daldinia decipiens]